MGDMLKSSREDNQIEECDSNPCVFFKNSIHTWF